MSSLPSPLTRSALVEDGLSRTRGDHLVRTRRWDRAAPSTYLLPDASLPERVGAALSHAGPGAVLTGWAACRLHRLPYADDRGAVDVLAPAARNRVSTAHVHVMATTRPPRWVAIGGVRVAAPERAVVDAARSLTSIREVRALVLGALGTVALEDLAAELRAGARRGRALVWRAIDDGRAGAASAPEAELAERAALAAAAGRLPPFLLNAEIRVQGVLLGRADGWLPDVALGWEVDSREHHGQDEDLDATFERHGRFLAHGLPLLHVTPRRLRARPDWTEALVAAAIARRGAVHPAGLEVRPRFPLQGRRRTAREHDHQAFR